MVGAEEKIGDVHLTAKATGTLGHMGHEHDLLHDVVVSSVDLRIYESTIMYVLCIFASKPGGSSLLFAFHIGLCIQVLSTHSSFSAPGIA